MKINVKDRKQDIIKIFIIVTLTIIAMYLFWNIKLKGYSMPIQHTVNYSGEFTTRIGDVREIVIQHEKWGEPVEIEIVVYDNNQQKCWEKIYKEVTIEGGKQTLDSFEKENPLELPEGSYIAEILVNGEKNTNLSCWFIEYSGSYKNIYAILCVLLLVGEGILFALYMKNKLEIHTIYFFSAVVLGVIMNFVMPPLGVPDEKTHFYEAYELSSRILFAQSVTESGEILIRECDYNNIEYLHNIASISEWYDGFGNDKNIEYISSGHQTIVSSRGKIAYIASAIGIALARMLGMSGNLLLICGRLTNLLMMSLIVALAIKIAPYGKYFFFVVGTFPEVIYLFTSYSYDSLNFALCMLSINYFLYLSYREQNIRMKELIIFTVLLVLWIPIKVVYILMGVLLILLPKEKIELSKKQIHMLLISCLVISLAVCVICIPTILEVVGINDNIQVVDNTKEMMSISFVKKNTLQAILVFFNTIFANTNEYFNNAFGEIVGIARYSGLDCYVVPSWMRIMIVIFMLVGLEDSRQNNLPSWKRIIIFVIALGTYLAILTSMFFEFTEVHSHKIQGIQGRYFLPIFLLLPVIVKNNFFTVNHKNKRICVLGMGLINLQFIFLIFFHYVCAYFV